MKRGRIIATCIAAAVVVGAGVASYALHTRGPVHRGRTVNGWLRQVFDPSHQGEALQALREMGVRAVPFEIRALTRSDSALNRWYQRVHRRAPFRKYLPEPVAAETIRSAAELALLNNPNAAEFIPQIVPLLEHKDPAVRSHASNILVNHLRAKDTFCIPTLIEALNNPQPNIRRNMVLALTRFGPDAKAAVPALERELKDDREQIRIDCAAALSVIDPNTATITKPVLKEALADRNARIRHWAAVHLSRIDVEDQQLVPVFVGSLTNSDPGIRMSAAYSLIPFGSKAESAVPSLIRALTDPETGVRQAARAALEKIDPKAAAEAGVR